MEQDNKIPWYLKQTDKELIEKFKFIQYQEDERLREATNGTADSRWSLGISVLEENDLRNRYVNIMPYERNRVALDVVNGNDYINASYIKVDIPQQSINPGHYISTQGPTKYTWQQFWQMCYRECPNENIVIVMVTPLKEHGREKCYPYWPMGGQSDVIKVAPRIQCPGGDKNRPNTTSTFFSELQIEYITSEKHDDNYTLTTLNLKPTNPKLGPPKLVHHFYFDKWRDMSKPEEVIPIMKLCNHSHSLNSGGNPIIVHCSAGVGRTGTFIALDHLIHDTLDFQAQENTILEVKQYKRDLIEQIVLQLRSQRMKMVQIKDQYIFIYHLALHLREKLAKRVKK
ncbi:tyrosine protein phosphatase PTP1 NDAI_0H03910 [Naumovozyma dairenensis CBS 421]|uniref:protein-tyrosine-phosphatase n=1 Tax=Naumovozyma dairenensis (strain ATCC 10597 / BCRC 20456 / CBS 421 / NBRC 0211 / NRRL Y-12639) TaxID=1071378 RepID=G0WFK3_NAUDC|nr:hypothetical protein NDAI_0H03910 [Naumovozyma dairenensis CBS 421]CCD26564.1 hypothetical protein NDAI_0H03910 [Naumovozyma dairenensis CBS 421]